MMERMFLSAVCTDGDYFNLRYPPKDRQTETEIERQSYTDRQGKKKCAREKRETKRQRKREQR